MRVLLDEGGGSGDGTSEGTQGIHRETEELRVSEGAFAGASRDSGSQSGQTTLALLGSCLGQVQVTPGSLTLR